MRLSVIRLVWLSLFLLPLVGAHGQAVRSAARQLTAPAPVKQAPTPMPKTPAPTKVGPAVAPKAFGYPEAPTVPLSSFVMLTSTMPLLPLSGGIYVPGLNSWFLAPTEKPMQSVSYCPADTSTYVTVMADKKVTLLQLKSRANKPSGTTLIGELPRGFYVACALARGQGLVWGLNAEGSGVWAWQDHKLKPIYQSKQAITAFVPLAPDAFAAAIDGNVLLFQGKTPPKQLVRCGRPIDGLSLTTDGTILASTSSGIIAVTPKKQWLVSAKVHGYLQIHKDKLYVLDTRDRKIVQVDVPGPN